MSNDKITMEAIYRRRFKGDEEFRQEMWKVLCSNFFQKYVQLNSTVLEIAAGSCEFINNIKAQRKIAVDINTDIYSHSNPDIEVIVCSSTDLSHIPLNTVDNIFVSNFFEHLTRSDIVITLKEAYRVLKPNGKILILQPNYRFCSKDYWMFFDHITAIDDRSLVEVLELQGYSVKEVIPRFLPYTTKSALPKSIFFVRTYLSLPLIWNIFGAQAFVVAEKK